MITEYFQAYSWWKIPQAEAYAKQKGLKTKWEDGKLFIEVKYYPAQFWIETGDDSEPFYEGFKRDMNDWNGWERPVFTREVTEKIVADYNKAATDGSSIKFEDEKLIYTYDPETENEPDIKEPFMIEVEGKQIAVYEVGNGWVWEKYSVNRNPELTELAIEFSNVLKKWLTKPQLTKVNELNKQEQDNMSHTRLLR